MSVAAQTRTLLEIATETAVSSQIVTIILYVRIRNRISCTCTIIGVDTVKERNNTVMKIHFVSSKTI